MAAVRRPYVCLAATAGTSPKGRAIEAIVTIATGSGALVVTPRDANFRHVVRATGLCMSRTIVRV